LIDVIHARRAEIEEDDIQNVDGGGGEEEESGKICLL
jgi:hypothetical protein